jgi:hypothetical protein
LQCRLDVSCSGSGSEVAGVDDKRARCASNSEAMSRQRPILCGGQDVGLVCVVDSGRYSICARYLCSCGCWARRGFRTAERVVSRKLDICAGGRALPLGFDQWRFGPGRYSYSSIRNMHSSCFSGIPWLCLFCSPDSASGLSSCSHSCPFRWGGGFCQRSLGPGLRVPSSVCLWSRYCQIYRSVARRQRLTAYLD